MNRPVAIRSAVAVAVSLALALGAPLAASAHVQVDPESAEPGGYALLTFRVPNESATATTTGVTIALPADTPFTSVSVEPIDGWSAEVVTAPLPAPVDVGGSTISEAPLSVIFTAIGTGIGNGEFQRFTLSAGPVPDVGKVLLPVAQSYSDGSVVEWNEPTSASGEEPENPAPTLYVTDAVPADQGDGAAVTTAEDSADPADGHDSTSVVVGFLALAVSAVALVVSALALVRARSARSARSASPADGR
jgi:uncharacterized protein YcnI